jgi:hypothetical protein
MIWSGLAFAFVSLCIGFWIVERCLRDRPGIQPRRRALLIRLAFFFVLIAAVTLGFHAYHIDIWRGRSRTFVWSGLGAVWFMAILWSLANRLRAGAVVLDLGPAGTRKLNAIVGAVLLLSGIVRFVAKDRILGVAYIVWGFWQFVMAFQRLQITGTGLLMPGVFLPWRKIERQEWVQHDKVALYRKRSFFKNPVEIQVPQQHAPEAHQLIASFLESPEAVGPR